jgi:hypothetical protein
MKVPVRIVACVALLALVWGNAGVPAVSASSGFSAKGALVVQTEFSGAKVNIGGNINLEQRGPLVRVDILSLAFPGLKGALGSLAQGALSSTQLFPQGGYSVVYDQAQHTYTVWAPSKHAYYTNEGGGPPPPVSDPASAAATTVGNASDMLHAFSAAKPLRDYRQFSASLNLTGHGTTNGHPSTGLNFALKRQERSGDPLDVHGTLQLADDLDELPVQIAASVKGAGGTPPTSLRLDFTSIDRRTPDEGDFSPPEGYTKAAKLSDVLIRSLP